MMTCLQPSGRVRIAAAAVHHVPVPRRGPQLYRIIAVEIRQPERMAGLVRKHRAWFVGLTRDEPIHAEVGPVNIERSGVGMGAKLIVIHHQPDEHRGASEDRRQVSAGRQPVGLRRKPVLDRCGSAESSSLVALHDAGRFRPSVDLAVPSIVST